MATRLITAQTKRRDQSCSPLGGAVDECQLRVRKRKWPRWNGMSVLPSTADIVRPLRQVRFVPEPEVALRLN
jgi:hypothetical protein